MCQYIFYTLLMSKKNYNPYFEATNFCFFTVYALILIFKNYF